MPPGEVFQGGLSDRSCQHPKLSGGRWEVWVFVQPRLSCIFPCKCLLGKLSGSRWEVLRGSWKLLLPKFYGFVWPKLSVENFPWERSDIFFDILWCSHFSLLFQIMCVQITQLSRRVLREWLGGSPGCCQWVGCPALALLNPKSIMTRILQSPIERHQSIRWHLWIDTKQLLQRQSLLKFNIILIKCVFLRNLRRFSKVRKLQKIICNSCTVIYTFTSGIRNSRTVKSNSWLHYSLVLRISSWGWSSTLHELTGSTFPR